MLSKETNEGASYPRFNGFFYSLDTLLPIVSLEMQEHWIPDETKGNTGIFARYLPLDPDLRGLGALALGGCRVLGVGAAGLRTDGTRLNPFVLCPRPPFMAIRPILLHPDPRLRKKCEPVEIVTDAVRTLASDMLETMYDAPGVGLAAPQVGATERMLVMDCSDKEAEERKPMVLLNPEIVSTSEEENTYEEGCLSIPEIYEDVSRPSEVRIRYMTLDGETVEEDFDGLWATCVQHEIDHLNGKLFIDYLSSLKRTMITSKMKKLKRERARA